MVEEGCVVYILEKVALQSRLGFYEGLIMLPLSAHSRGAWLSTLYTPSASMTVVDRNSKCIGFRTPLYPPPTTRLSTGDDGGDCCGGKTH